MSHCQSTFTYWLIISLNLTLPVYFDQLADTDPEFDMFHLKCLKLVIFSSYKSFSSIWEGFLDLLQIREDYCEPCENL